jgi:hypothetical protein
LLHRRHAAYYLELAEQAGNGADLSRSSYMGIQLALFNIQAALRWEMQSGDVENALGLCGALSGFLYFRAQPSESRRWLAEMLAAPAAARPTVGRGGALLSAARLAWGPLGAIAPVCFYLGDYPAVRAYFEQQSAAGGSADQPPNAPTLDWLGHVATASGDYAAARTLYAAGACQRLAVDRLIGVAFTLSGLAGLAVAQGQLRRSVRISGAASRLGELSGVPSHRTQEGYIRGRLPGIREAIGAADYDVAWSEGRAMTLEQAVAYGLEETAGSVDPHRDTATR